ncbi:DUF5343 domain-containing protein [Bradyrhizobium sp. 147]|nr:DUF5343 domain-containing protein [Bradyrhizobium sp. 147]
MTKILDKIIEASQPERFTQDFLATKLGYSSGSARPMIPLLKKLGFIATDGAPTGLYSQFRNPENRGAAMAQALRAAYKEIYDRNEYAHDLTRDKLKNLVVEITGLEPDNQTVTAIVGTFWNLKAYADFEKAPATDNGNGKVTVLEKTEPVVPPVSPAAVSTPSGLNLSYTINLNLPETTDVEVFNAIFRSLKENLLKV